MALALVTFVDLPMHRDTGPPVRAPGPFTVAE